MNPSPNVESILADVLDLPESSITSNVTMKDLDEWDSLKHMELIVALEQAYGIEFTFEEIVTMVDIPSIRRVVQMHAEP